MIVIDMDMPKCWDDCSFNNGCECCLVDAVCTDETAGENGELPSFCPIKCDIKDIKAEIEQNAYPIVHGVNNHEQGMTLYGILQIIDKYRG